MNRGIYAPASGMMNNERLLDIVANNLANTTTNAYKRDGITFVEAMQMEMNANGGQGGSLGSIGLSPDAGNEFTVMEQGPINSTHRQLDVAIKGEKGMFAVQTTNGVQYTRDGSFSIDANGVLVNQSGYPVLDSTYHWIQVNGSDVTISPEGTVSVTNGGKVSAAGQIAVFTGNFTKLGSNNWAGTNTAYDDSIQLEPGAIEGSNVNPVEEMVNLIKIGRAYELQQKAISQQDELNQKITTAIG